MERKRKQVEVVVGGEFLCLSCIDSLLFNLPEKDLPAGVSDIFERYPQIFEFQNRDRGKGEEGISVVLCSSMVADLFPILCSLSRFIEIGRLESHRKWGRMQPYAQQPRNSPRVRRRRPISLFFSPLHTRMQREQGRFACEKKK